MRHIISLLLENEPGALSRVVGLFSQRNNNIESLTIFKCPDIKPDAIPEFARMKGLKRLVIDQNWKETSWKRDLANLPSFEYESYKKNKHD